MKIKNYEWNGFGFPIIFDELPAVKVRSELIPDVDFNQYAKPLVEFICSHQDVPFSGNQVKFIRNYFNLSLREFAKMLNVKHQSIMRWEDKNQSAARIDANTEIVMRLIVLKRVKSQESSLKLVVNKVDSMREFTKAGEYKKFKSIRYTLQSELV